MTSVLHLITQRNQPYGSVRHCCEKCGAYGLIGNGTHFYTDDPSVFERGVTDFVTCDRVSSEVANAPPER